MGGPTVRKRDDRTLVPTAPCPTIRPVTTNFDEAERHRLMELIDTHTKPFWETLGIVAKEVHERGHVTVGLAMHHAVSNRNGVVHGGAIMSLIDAAGGGATRTLTSPGEPVPAFPTTDLNVSFLNPARGT